VLFVGFRFGIETEGQAQLPAGGYSPGRSRPSRLDGPIRGAPRHSRRAARLVPGQRAVDVHVALARAADPSNWGPAARLAGGLGIDQHVASARSVIANGGVFVQMPEGTVSGPPGRIGQFRTGWRSSRGGRTRRSCRWPWLATDELYIGRRMASRVLPVTSVRALADLGPNAH